MRCPIETREQELLLEYCSGTLDRERAAHVREHIGTCRVCGEFTARQAAVWRALEGWDAPAVSPGFDQRLYARIGKEVSWWDLALRPLGVLVERSPRPAGVRVPESAQVDVASPDQVERALDDMEMLREFNGMVRPDTADPKM